MKFQGPFCGFALWLILSAQATAQTRVYVAQAAKDNTLYQDVAGALSNGAGEYFFAGKAGAASIRRGVLAFDLAGLPKRALISNANLTLHMSRTSNASAFPISLHRTLADWGEGISDATGEEGGGAASTTGDATWSHTFFATGFWTSSGGDFEAIASAMTPVALEGDYVWTNAAMATDVQFWSLNRTQNFGWTIRGEEATNGTTKRFDSRQNVNAAVRPRLTIEYELRCPWDLSDDDSLGVEDLAILLAHFGMDIGAAWADGDIDADGDVDLSDLAELLARFGSVCPP